MNPVPTNHNQPPAPQEGANPLELVAVLLRRWRILAFAVAGSLVVALIALLLLPRSYAAEVVMVPSISENESRAQMLAAQLRLPAIVGMAGGDQKQGLVEAILRSRSLQEFVLEKTLPHTATEERRRELTKLIENASVRSNPANRSISVRIETRDPVLSAQIANHFPAAVNEIATRVAVETAVHKRDVLERQLATAKERLAHSEEQLLAYEQDHNAPAVEEQAKRSVEAAAELQRQVIGAEVQLTRLRRSATEDNPQVQSAVTELNALRAQLRRLTSERRSGDVFLAQSELPEVKLAVSRLVREYTKDEQIFIHLTATLAGIESDANNDLSVVTVLDQAEVPESPSGPRRTLVLAVGLLFGVVGGLFLAFLVEYVRRMRATAGDAELAAAWNGFKIDIDRMVPRPRRAKQPSVRGGP